MALIGCPECQKEISDKTKNCPHCGYPLENNSIGKPLNFKNLYDKNWNKIKDFNEWKPAVKTGINILAIYLWIGVIVGIIGLIISVQMCNVA